MKRDELNVLLYRIYANGVADGMSKTDDAEYPIEQEVAQILAEFSRLSKIEEAARLCLEAVSDKSLSDGAFRFTVASLLSGQNPPTLTEEEKRKLQTTLGKDNSDE